MEAISARKLNALWAFNPVEITGEEPAWVAGQLHLLSQREVREKQTRARVSLDTWVDISSAMGRRLLSGSCIMLGNRLCAGTGSDMRNLESWNNPCGKALDRLLRRTCTVVGYVRCSTQQDEFTRWCGWRKEVWRVRRPRYEVLPRRVLHAQVGSCGGAKGATEELRDLMREGGGLKTSWSDEPRRMHEKKPRRDRFIVIMKLKLKWQLKFRWLDLPCRPRD